MSEFSNSSNKADSEAVSSEMDKDSFFSKEGMLNSPSNEPEGYDISSPERKRWAVIEYIAKNPKSSCYRIEKATGINHSQAHQILRELTFSRVLIVQQALDSQSRPIEVFSLPTREEDAKQ